MEYPARDNFLRQFYEDSGLLDVGGLRENIRNAADTTDVPTFDEAFQLAHRFLLIEIDPEVRKLLQDQLLLGDGWTEDTRERVKERLHSFHSAIELRGVLLLCQRIAEAFIVDQPESNPIGRSTELWRALEALMWRSYEALKSTNILLKEGVMEDLVTLGVAQEALIRFKFLRTNPGRVNDFVACDLYGEWRQINEYIEWSVKNSIPLPSDQSLRLSEISSELKAIRFDLQRPDDIKRLNKLRVELNWRNLIVLEGPSEDVFQSHPTIRYQEVFTPRDRVAHSLAQIWPCYTRIAGDSINVVATISDPPHQPLKLALFTWADFFSALRYLRPQLATGYDTWCHTIYKALMLSTK